VLRVETDRDAALLGLAGGGNDLGLNAVRRIDAAGCAVDARQTAAPARARGCQAEVKKGKKKLQKIDFFSSKKMIFFFFFFSLWHALTSPCRGQT
jgi:hypothetical protein